MCGLIGRGAIGIVFVDRTPWHTLRMWPFWVSSDSGKCLLTVLTVMCGHMRNVRQGLRSTKTIPIAPLTITPHMPLLSPKYLF